MRSKTMSKRTSAETTRQGYHGPARARTALGALPEWNLADLYSGLDDPAIKRDLDRADADCVAFETCLQGQACRSGAIPAGRQRARRSGAPL